MRGCDEGKTNACANCCEVWEFLTADKLKASQFTWDGGSVISKIIEFESKTKIEFEYEHAKTKNDNENEIINKVLTMVLEYDQKAKEESVW